MFKNKSVSVHNFAMVPRADIPRSSFRMQKALKTAFNAGYLVPILCEEILPGDTFNVKLTAFCRLATPIFPVLDNLHMETFFFFVPNRLVWSNWEKFMGDRSPDPDSSTDYLIPQVDHTGAAPAVGSLFDYFGLPCIGQVASSTGYTHSSLPMRGYNLIWNEWFRDQNLQDGAALPIGDGPDTGSMFPLRLRGKRHDYFTSCLPWPQKGEAVSVNLGGLAPIGTSNNAGAGVQVRDFDVPGNYFNINTSGAVGTFATGSTGDATLFADLSVATGITINALRQSFQVQKLLERDARGGTRYTEIVRSHFGVVSPDSRLQRPEYLGGGHSLIQINPVAQTSETVETPQGNLSAFGTALLQGHGFTQSFTEHGYVIGLVNVRADLTYQQGIRRHWSRQTRYDFYFPVFAALGEQAVLSKEIYFNGTAGDNDVFGYQERWAEYRYNPSEVTGLMRSTATGTIDAWHYAEKFLARPVLGNTFISDLSSVVVGRTTAVEEQALGQQLIMDAFYDIKAARPMPVYSVPGLIDHF